MISRFTSLLFFVTLLGLGNSTEAARAPADEGGSLEIYFIDVQGGAATLIVTPERESILIDSGWPGLEDRDPKRVVHALKDLAGCDHLDHLVTTHWHRDHFGGVEGLDKLVRIGQFWDRGLPEDAGAKGEFPDGPSVEDPLGVAYRKASAGKRKSLKAGDTLPFKGLEALVLASGGEVVSRDIASRFRGGALAGEANRLCQSAPPDQPVDTSDNARSLAILFSLGRFQFFDAGDLTWNVEKKLVCPIDLIGPVDLYQVTHHGMDNSNHPTLVQTVAPVVAIMNNGPRKGGAPATVKLLKSVPSILGAYQLHKNAASSAEENTDAGLIANREPTGGELIRVRVTADGSKFTVQLGERGPEKSFESR
jgi:beta-lactamase superfamily II metal-dependent hydrolase